MTVISHSSPQPAAIPGYRSAVAAGIRSWLDGLDQRLRAARVDEFLRSLDKRAREDFGIDSYDSEQSSTVAAGKNLGGLLREVFTWTRFSK
jgi:hypothetical protein